MLLQFLCKNVLSFKDETILDLTAVHAYKELDSNCISFGKNEKALRVAAIYGANASGKSNLWEAMNVFSRIVRQSMNEEDVEHDRSIAIKEYYVPFLLDSDTDNSGFQISGIYDDIEFRYGFEYNSENIVEEWLYTVKLSTQRQTVVVERVGSEIKFGSTVKGKCDAYKDQIPNTALVLTFLNKLKNCPEPFKKVYDSISDVIFLSSSRKTRAFLESVLPKFIDEEKERLDSYLHAIDSGIKSIRYDDEKPEKPIYTIHQGIDGQEYALSLWNESAGTIKAIELFLCIFVTMDNDGLLVIDELHNMLHPLLQKFIVDLFYSDTNSKAQLIYTTHDTTLLDKKFFRRDQIWFVQKAENGCSSLVALSDYKVRSDASFEKDYLAGVYGGIPQLRDFELEKGASTNGDK